MVRRQHSDPILRPGAATLRRKRAGGFPLWKTIMLGTHDSAGGLREALNTAGFGVGDLAREALNRLVLTARPSTRLDLVVVSGFEIGLTAANASLAEICSRAAALGLMLCPAEVAPQLRLQYPDQPAGEFLRVAMAPVATSRGDVGFVVGNGGLGLLLIGADGRPDRLISPTVRFVFVHAGPTAAVRN